MALYLAFVAYGTACVALGAYVDRELRSGNMARLKVSVQGMDQLIKLTCQAVVKLDEIKVLLAQDQQRDSLMAADITTIAERVAPLGDAVQSAISLIEELHQALLDAIANDDPAAFQEIADQLDAQKQALADAILANTPSDPNAPPEG